MGNSNFRKGPHASKNRPADNAESLSDEMVPASDERKTIVLDEDLDGVEFEDRVWLYWKRNKNFIIFSVVAAFAIIIGVQGFKMYRANVKAQLAEAYAAAQTPEQLTKFAEENAGKKLAGAALLQNADRLYADGKYAEAQKSYETAQADLNGTILEGRAMIGAAVSAGSQDIAKGIEALEKISNDNSIDAAYKAQAGYLLGLYYAQVGKQSEAKAAFKGVIGNSNSGYFGKLAEESLSKIN